MRRRAAAALASERLVLRLVEEDDARALLALYSDPEVMRYWNHAPWSSLAQAERAIDEAHREFLAGSSVHYAIEHRASHAVVGSCALYDIGGQRRRRASLGYLLARHAWGRGYLNEAMPALLRHAFGALALDTVRAQVHPDNAASAALLAKHGFRPEPGMAHSWSVFGQRCTPLGFSMTRVRWAARTRPDGGQA